MNLITESFKRRLLTLPAVAILFLCLWGLAVPVLAEPQDAGEKDGEPETAIRITGDRLETSHKTGWVEFIGNVTAEQGDIVMTADRMKIFFDMEGDAFKETGRIEKIVSEGGVKIVFDKGTKTAEGDKAVYLAEKKVLELHGEDAKVWSGKNVVRGKKITVYYTENRSVVEGATGDQVEATLFVKEGGGLIE